MKDIVPQATLLYHALGAGVEAQISLGTRQHPAESCPGRDCFPTALPWSCTSRVLWHNQVLLHASFCAMGSTHLCQDWAEAPALGITAWAQLSWVPGLPHIQPLGRILPFSGECHLAHRSFEKGRSHRRQNSSQRAGRRSCIHKKFFCFWLNLRDNCFFSGFPAIKLLSGFPKELA